MKPVDMISKHDPENELYGDCFRACLASLLEFPPEDVPHIMDGNPDREEFNRRTSNFLKAHGLFLIEIPAFDMPEYLDTISVKDVWHLISGPSPRFADTWHAVVGHNGKIAHDPHTERTGLMGDPKEWMYGFLVRLNG